MLFNYITVSRICIPPDLALWSGGDGTRTRDPLDAINTSPLFLPAHMYAIISDLVV